MCRECALLSCFIGAGAGGGWHSTCLDQVSTLESTLDSRRQPQSQALSSRCFARLRRALRVAVGCGVWRANHKTITAWAAAGNKSNDMTA